MSATNALLRSLLLANQPLFPHHGLRIRLTPVTSAAFLRLAFQCGRFGRAFRAGRGFSRNFEPVTVAALAGPAGFAETRRTTMLRPIGILACAAVVGLAGMLSAVSVAGDCESGGGYSGGGYSDGGFSDGAANFEDGEATDDVLPVWSAESSGPGLAKARNVSTGKRKASGTANQAGLAKRAQALLKAKCVRCHGGSKREGGLDLRSRQAVIAGGEQLLQRVQDGEMPPGKPLSQKEIATLQQWIAAGAPAGK